MEEEETMTKIFVSPSDFILGKNILKTGKDYLTKFGTKPFLLGDSFVMEMVGNDFADYLNGEEFDVQKQVFEGEASMAAIEKFTSLSGSAEERRSIP
jgi:glycerol dehydrogenase